MKKLLYTFVAATMLGAATSSAVAGDNVVMVELFTSQGCSSCPPADAALAELAARDDVLALSMHVDYWDYLGWRDTFGNPDNTARQYQYRDALGARVVFTPQMIVHGTYNVPGYRTDAILEAIVQVASAAQTVSINVEKSDGMAYARIATKGATGDCTVWIAAFRHEAPVEIKRGENAGRTITYHNVVKSLQRVGVWKGTGSERLHLPQPRPGEGVAVWVQSNQTGRILAASFIDG